MSTGDLVSNSLLKKKHESSSSPIFLRKFFIIYRTRTQGLVGKEKRENKGKIVLRVKDPSMFGS